MAIAEMNANSPYPAGGFGHTYPGSDNDLRAEEMLRGDNVDNPCLRIVTFWPRSDSGSNTLCVHFGSVKDVTVDGYLVHVDHPVDYITPCIVPRKPRHPSTNPTGCWMGLDWHGPAGGGHRPSSASLSQHDFGCVSCRPNTDSGWTDANHIGAKVLAMDYESRKEALQSAGYATSILLKQELELSKPTVCSDLIQANLRQQRGWSYRTGDLQQQATDLNQEAADLNRQAQTADQERQKLEEVTQKLEEGLQKIKKLEEGLQKIKDERQKIEAEITKLEEENQKLRDDLK